MNHDFVSLPNLEIKIDGVPLPQQAQLDLIAVTVEESLDAASMCSLQFYNWDANELAYSWSDDARFTPRSKVEITLGYVNRLSTVFQGELTGIEPEFGGDSVPTVTFRGYDYGHRLMHSPRSQTYKDMTVTQIATQIASRAGLGIVAEDSTVVQDTTSQIRQTDMDFLRQCATQIGFEVFVEQTLLHFHSARKTSKPTVELSLDKDLFEFTPRLSVMGQVSEVEVRSWDAKGKQTLSGKAQAGSETPNMKGSLTGSQAAQKAFSASSAVSIDIPALSQQETEKLAQAHLNEISRQYVTGNASLQGRTDINPGNMAQISGAGKRFSGLYYITSVTHRITENEGFTTSFGFQRNAV